MDLGSELERAGSDLEAGRVTSRLRVGLPRETRHGMCMPPPDRPHEMASPQHPLRGPREECRLGRWSGWLVLAERDADGAMPSQLRRLVTEAGAPSPLEELLLPAGAPSVLRWEDVGDSTWCFFSLLHRVAPSLVQPQQVDLVWMSMGQIAADAAPPARVVASQGLALF